MIPFKYHVIFLNTRYLNGITLDNITWKMRIILLWKECDCARVNWQSHTLIKSVALPLLTASGCWLWRVSLYKYITYNKLLWKIYSLQQSFSSRIISQCKYFSYVFFYICIILHFYNFSPFLHLFNIILLLV